MAIIPGTSGDDTLNGTSGDDIITGGAGNDTIDSTGDGSDLVSGGEGNDTITASSFTGQTETLYGGAGDDVFNITSGDGTFFVSGGSGANTFNGLGASFSGDVIVDLTGGGTLDLVNVDPSKVSFYVGDLDANDITVVQDAGVNQFTVTIGSTVVTIDGSGMPWISVTAADFTTPANILTTSEYTPAADPDPECLTTGTMVLTDDGERLVEDLKVGDLVMTRDNGAQPVRWIGQRTFAATGKRAPVVIAKGALGNTRDLVVSQYHRMLISDYRAELVSGKSEVLAAAVDLLDGDRIYRREGGEVTYVHVAFDKHEIIFAEGAPTESLQPFEMSAETFGSKALEELLDVFPELKNGGKINRKLARPTITASEASLLN